MARIRSAVGTCTIASGGTASSAVTFNKTAPRAVTIFAPAALTGVCKVKVSGDGGSTYQFLQSGGADIEVGAGDAVVIDYVGYDTLQIVSDSAEAADRAFVVRAVEEIN